MNTKIILHQVEIPVFLGWQPEERIHQQIVFLDLQLVFPQPPTACDTDRLEDTYCYHTLTLGMAENIGTRHFHLLEYLAAEVYRYLKKIISPDILIALRFTKKPSINFPNQGASFCYGDFPWSF